MALKTIENGCRNEYVIRVFSGGVSVVEERISELHGRVIALLACEGANHCGEHPEHLPFVMGRIAETVEASLQCRPSAHRKWTDLYSNHAPTLAVQLDVSEAGEPTAADAHSGGIGGNGRLFGAGGGGGGPGLLVGGAGGFGADGAAMVFQVASDWSLIDIETFVSPGSSTHDVRPDAYALKVILIGGGGGGGLGGHLV